MQKLKFLALYSDDFDQASVDQDFLSGDEGSPLKALEDREADALEQAIATDFAEAKRAAWHIPSLEDGRPSGP